jgi:DNA-binding MarR family transcriptional regulator
MTSAEASANVLGALATAIADRSAEAVAAAAGQSLSAATALSALHHFLDRPTLDSLRRVLGLTPSGAVRLVDRLAADGLVTRGPGGDKRSRSVTLTDAGREAAERVSAARARVLSDVLDVLPPADRAVLHDLLGRLMAGVVRTKDGGAWICRLCDLDACGRAAGHCPAANAAAEKYGFPSPGP